jgi:hypothetical protein
MRTLLLALSLVVLLLAAREPQAWTPATIQWQEVNADGTKYSVLQGRRDVPGESAPRGMSRRDGPWRAPCSKL